MSTTTTVLVGVLGGVGGAALTGVIQVFASAAADRRRSQHELDAWLREKRYEAVNALMKLVQTPPDVDDREVRLAYAHEVASAVISLHTVVPRSLGKELRDYLKKLDEATEEDDFVKASFFMGWHASQLQSRLSNILGWDQEPIRARAKKLRLRRFRARWKRTPRS